MPKFRKKYHARDGKRKIHSRDEADYFGEKEKEALKASSSTSYKDCVDSA